MVVDPGLLKRMEHLGGADALDGRDFSEVVDSAHFGDAGADNLAVQQDGAGAAGALAAADFDARDVQLLAQDIDEGVVVVDDDAVLNAVHNEGFSLHEASPWYGVISL